MIRIYINANNLEVFVAPFNNREENEPVFGESARIENFLIGDSIVRDKEEFVRRLGLSVQPFGRKLTFWEDSRPVHYFTRDMPGFDVLLNRLNWLYGWFDSDPRTSGSNSNALFLW